MTRLTASLLVVFLSAMGFLVALTFSAYPQTITAEYPPNIVAEIHIDNPQGSNNPVASFETDWGTVTVRYRTTGNGANGCCPDVVEIIDHPPGTAAIPPALEVPEEGHGIIQIIEQVGM